MCKFAGSILLYVQKQALIFSVNSVDIITVTVYNLYIQN